MSPEASSLDPESPRRRKAPDDAAADLAEQAQGVLDAVKREVVNQAQTRPYTTVMVALAAGYVLGVGTPRWMTRLALNTAGRVAVSRLVASI